MMKANERDIVVTDMEIFQHERAMEALVKIHCKMCSPTSKGEYLQFKRAINKANRIGNLAPVAQKVIEYAIDREVDLGVADIYANAIRNKIAEIPVVDVDFSNIKKLRLREQGGKCAICGGHLEEKDVQAGHIIPKQLVGNTLGDDNIQAVCRHCNSHNRVHYNVRDFIVNYKLGRILI